MYQSSGPSRDKKEICQASVLVMHVSLEQTTVTCRAPESAPLEPAPFEPALQTKASKTTGIFRSFENGKHKLIFYRPLPT